ncbi:MAG TPA: nucleoside transporter C-terminal domain-containing protein [Vicinamibacteria bacterium]|nr:nucleoside transporter C-terminal domain-containing protein [Vicinamibacteria bacterium]
MERLLSLLGLLVFMGIAWALSTDRRAVRLRTILWGLGLQFALALFVLKTPLGQELFSWVGSKITRLLNLSFVGSEFVFGALGIQGGGRLPVTANGTAGLAAVGFVFAFQILPTIIFVAALFAILYHLGVMQLVVKAVAKVMTRLMGASGAESLNVAASIFMGQTEAPLTIRPFLNRMTMSELMCVMTAGMAHVSGSIMAAYIAFGVEAKHLLAAVIMTAPGTILLAKILVPETERPDTAGTVTLEAVKHDANVLGAAARGTSEGLHLALNVAAMLISFLSLVALVNVLLGKLGGLVHVPLSLETILGWAFMPLALVMGVPWKDAFAIGNLLGTRMVLNELIAYSQLGALKASLDPRTFTIATYALCGFANFSSIGIQLGGIGALAPERRDDLARLGLRAMLAGTFANFMTACIAGALL